MPSLSPCPITLAKWLSASKSATIRRRIDSLSSVFRYVEQADPTRHPTVTLALKRMHRQLGRVQSQATPLTRELLERLKTATDSNLRRQRDVLILQLGYETMRRRSELVRFRFEDRRELASGKPGQFLINSKTDQFGDGKVIPVSHTLNDLTQAWAGRLGSM